MSLREFILDPVAIKEVSGSSRRWQSFAGRCVYVIMIGIMVWNFWKTFPANAAFLTLSDYARLGHDLFGGFFGLQMAIVTMTAVSAASDMVTKESRSGTLGLLACTPLTPWRIAAGKWKAAMAQTSTTLLCGAPILAICAFLGGATAWDLTYSLTLSVVVAALGASVALYLSSVFRSGVTAILVSLAILGAGAFLPALIIEPPSRGSSATAMTCMLHPVYAAIVAATPRYTQGDNAYLQYGWISATLMNMGIVMILLRRTAARLETLIIRTPPTPILTRTFEAMDRFYEGVGPEGLRKIRFFSDRGEVWDTRAILWKELRVRATGKLRNAVRISLALLLLLVNSFWLPENWLPSTVWVPSVALLCMALSNGASLFVTEKEERKWDILLATPLPSSDILHAKLLAGLVPLVPILILTTLFWAGLSWAYRISLGDLVLIGTVALLPALLAYVLAAACSLHARTLRGAFTAAAAGLVGLLVGVPLLISLNDPFSAGTAFINPAPYLGKISESLRWYGMTGQFRLASYLEASVFFFFIYLMAIGIALVVMNQRFDEVSGRS